MRKRSSSQVGVGTFVRMPERRRETAQFAAGNSEAFAIESGLGRVAREAHFRPVKGWGRPSCVRAIKGRGGIGSASGLLGCSPPTRLPSQTCRRGCRRPIPLQVKDDSRTNSAAGPQDRPSLGWEERLGSSLRLSFLHSRSDGDPPRTAHLSSIHSDCSSMALCRAPPIFF